MNLGRPSMGENFTYAMQADKDMLLYPMGDKGFVWNDMLEDLIQGNVLHNMYISDMLSAQFYDAPEVMQAIKDTYDGQNAAFYGHGDTYWEGIEGPVCAPARETFAELCALYSENDKQSIKFVEKWFPNVVKRFWKELE